MTQEETLKRIEEDADNASAKIPDDGMKSPSFYYGYTDGFIDGAKSERNKTINEAIAIANSKTSLIVGMGDFIKELQSLKVDL